MSAKFLPHSFAGKYARPSVARLYHGSTLFQRCHATQGPTIESKVGRTHGRLTTKKKSANYCTHRSQSGNLRANHPTFVPSKGSCPIWALIRLPDRGYTAA